MWTPTIINKQLVNGRLSVTVEFNSDSGSKATETIKGDTVEAIKAHIRSYIEYFTKSEVALSEVPSGAIDPTDTTIAPVVSDQDQWQKDYQTLSSVQRLIDLGVLTGSETQVVALRTKVKTNFLPEYLGLI